MLSSQFKPTFFSANSLSSPSLLSRQALSTLSSCTSKPRTTALCILADHPNPEISRFDQKGFSEITNPIAGRSVHCLSIRHCLNLSIFHSNTLISMYFKFGSSDAALDVFDRMPRRNDASWNTAISGAFRTGLLSRGMNLFKEMREEGFGPNGFVLTSMVTAWNKFFSRVSRGTEVHGFVLRLGFQSDVYVGTALLHLYGKCGFVADVGRFFEEMPERNVVSWTALMVSYSLNGLPEEAVRAYRKMIQEGVVCNQNLFTTMISSCGMLENGKLGLEVLAHVVVYGFENEVSVANSLITLFGKLGRVEDAEHLFHRTREKDTISWNSMITI